MIEIGEHGNQRGFSLLKSFDIEGGIGPSPDSDGVLLINLNQIATPGQPPHPNALHIAGRVEAQTLTLTASGLRLENLPPQSLPTPIRSQLAKLDLAGDIGATTLTYHLSDGRMLARAQVSNIGLNLPASAKPGVDKDGKIIPVPDHLKQHQLRMEASKGELVLTEQKLTGTFSGRIDEFPYELSFSLLGLNQNAPFSAHLISTDFVLKEDPDLVHFAPGVVQRRLQQFSNPTGIVNLDLLISRAAAVNGQTPEVAVSGTIKLSHGSAAFDRFPYRFHNMSMDAMFTDTRLELRDIVGDTPEGAKVHASATVSPLTDDAGVVVDVSVTNLPVNATLASAMKHRGKIVDVLFNQEQFRRMVEAGLVISPTTHETLTLRRDALKARMASLTLAEQVELSELAGKLGRPVFEPGGTGTVDVHVTRIEGPESIWNDTVDIAFEKVGILPEAFPYPMIGHNVTIKKIDYDATVSGGTYTGLTGATAAMAAKVDLQKLDDPEAPFVPMVEVDAKSVPADDLLLFALPAASAISPDGRPLRELIRDLHIAGSADAHARIWQLEGQEAGEYGNTGYDIELSVGDVSALPRKSGQPPRLAVGGMNGTINIRHNQLALDLKAIAGPTTAAPDAGAAVHLKTRIDNVPRSPTGERVASRLTLDAFGEYLDADARIEDLIWLFAPEASIAISDARAQFQPEGRADVLATLRREAGGILEVNARAWKPAGTQLSLFGTRIGVQCDESTQESPLIEFVPGARGESGVIKFAGVPMTISGTTGFAAQATVLGSLRADRSPVPGDTAGLTVGVQGVLGSPPVSGFLSQTAPKGVVDFLTQNQAAGTFDATFNVMPTESGTWLTKGRILPHSLRLVLASTAVNFPTVSGTIDLSGAKRLVCGHPP